jgi:hypothetical protein
VVTTIAVLVAAAPASAGMVVGVSMDRLGPVGGDLDLTFFDPFESSGVAFITPSGVNTTADEEDLALSGNGPRLFWKGLSPSRLNTLDLGGGRQGAFELPDLPANQTGTFDSGFFGSGFGVSPDGLRLAVSLTFTSSPAPRTTGALLFSTDPFPGGPFSLVSTPILSDDRLQDQIVRAQVIGSDPVVANNGRVAWQAYGRQNGVVFGSSTGTLTFAPINVEQLALRPGDNTSVTAIKDRNLVRIAFDGSPSLELLSLPGASLAGEERFPQWTRDGRYLVWLAVGPPIQATGGELREGIIKVYDTETQAIVATRSLSRKERFRALAVMQTPSVLAAFDVNLGLQQTDPSLSVRLATSATVGILVQRVMGTRRLLGRRAPRLKLVGRVPLGKQRRGRARIAWDGKVNGRELPAGRYQITMRRLVRKKVVELSEPDTVRIR